MKLPVSPLVVLSLITMAQASDYTEVKVYNSADCSGDSVGKEFGRTYGTPTSCLGIGDAKNSAEFANRAYSTCQGEFSLCIAIG